MIAIVLLGVVAAICAVWIFLQARRGNELEMLPSIVWLAMMTVPFLAQTGDFPARTAAHQAFGIAIVAVVLLAGDGFFARNVGAAPSVLPSLIRGRLYRVLVTLFLIGAIAHLLLVDDVPLLRQLAGSTTDERALQWMREQMSKLLAVPDVVKYVLNWLIAIVAPLAFAGLLVERRFLLAAGFLVLALAYAAMSLATLPALILVFPVAALILSRLSLRKRRRVYLAVALIAAIPVADAVRFLVLDENSVLNFRPSDESVTRLGLANDDPRAKLTRGDHLRLRPREIERSFAFRERKYEYVFYRALLTPAEVSNRWYQYYPDVAGGYAGLAALTPATRRDASRHPASVVGNWAYTDRFPDRYLRTIRAYASVDADAHARFGAVGVILAGIAILGVRLALRWLRTDVLESEVLYLIALAEFALLLPMASLQAILVANGLLIILALMLGIRLVRLRRAWTLAQPQGGESR